MTERLQKYYKKSFSFIFLIREMEILKNMLVKIWLPQGHDMSYQIVPR